jgi:hypothetical protein
MNQQWGKWIMAIGAGIFLVGLLFYFFHNKLGWLGKLPGDIRIERENFRFYFPIATSILVSLVVSAIIYLFRKL